MTFKLFTVNNFKKLKINLNKKLNIILKYFFYRGDGFVAQIDER